MLRFIIWLLALALFASCSPNNVTVDNTLEKYFKQNNVKGCFGLFNNTQENFIIYNLSRYRDSAYLPASTFKIVNGLIGLKTGVIFDEKMMLEWDGIVREHPEWNKNLSMTEAFKNSAVPYFQEVARRIGKDTMQMWLDSLKYGNRQISTIDSFWLDNSLKITPDEQLGLVKKLYFEKLPMDKRPQRIIKEVMLMENNSNYKLSFKTGTGINENGDYIGWIVGWLEENRRPYFFVLNIEGKNSDDFSGKSKIILKDILKHLGYLEGRK